MLVWKIYYYAYHAVAATLIVTSTDVTIAQNGKRARHRARES